MNNLDYYNQNISQKENSVGQIIWTVTNLILLQVIMEKGILAHPLSS